jgi:hypothetical protein
VVEPGAIEMIQVPMAGGAHVALLAADGSFAALQACALAGIEPSALNALPDALLLVFASLVDVNVAVHGRWRRSGCGHSLCKADGGSKCEKSDAKQRDFHGVSP